jgi:beta-glucanase (GH16 family)
MQFFSKQFKQFKMEKSFVFIIFLLLTQISMFCQPAGYVNLVFSDDFDGTELNTEKWSADNCTTHGSGECEESMFYMKENVTVSGGNLNLTAKRQDVKCNGKTKHFTSGQVHSPDYLYGYFEINAKLPKGNGFWPAFWFWSGCNTDSYREMDVLESCGCDCNDYQAGFFYETDNNNSAGDPAIHPHTTVNIDGLCTSFHKYGLEWSPTTVSFYLDGVKKFTKPNPNFTIPMPIILNLAVEGCWGGCGWEYCGFNGAWEWDTNGSCHIDCNTEFPKTYEIDYVKIWQKQGTSINLLGPVELCVGKTYTYYASFYPGAEYTWTVSDGLTKNELPWQYWGCNPVKGVFKQIEVTPTTKGSKTITVKVNFPDGYSETKTLVVKVDDSPPSTPISITFEKNAAECCFYPVVTPVSNATHYSWNVNGTTFTTTGGGSIECIPENLFGNVKVSAVNGCGESGILSVTKKMPKIPGCHHPWGKLSPNPSTGIVKVEIFKDEQLMEIYSGKIFIYDSFGSMVYLTELTMNGEEINLSNLENGVYKLTVINELEIVQMNFIKSNEN